MILFVSLNHCEKESSSASTILIDTFRTWDGINQKLWKMTVLDISSEFIDQESIMNKKSSLWNSSSESLGNYATRFPYTVVDEDSIQHMINITNHHANIMKINNMNDTLPIPPCDYLDSFFAVEYQTALNILYPTILFVAAIGNIIVCFIVCSSSRMQTVTNYFITNLGEWRKLKSTIILNINAVIRIFIKMNSFKWYDYGNLLYTLHIYFAICATVSSLWSKFRSFKSH